MWSPAMFAPVKSCKYLIYNRNPKFSTNFRFAKITPNPANLLMNTVGR